VEAWRGKKKDGDKKVKPTLPRVGREKKGRKTPSGALDIYMVRYRLRLKRDNIRTKRNQGVELKGERGEKQGGGDREGEKGRGKKNTTAAKKIKGKFPGKDSARRGGVEGEMKGQGKTARKVRNRKIRRKKTQTLERKGEKE